MIWLILSLAILLAGIFYLSRGQKCSRGFGTEHKSELYYIVGFAFYVMGTIGSIFWLIVEVAKWIQ